MKKMPKVLFALGLMTAAMAGGALADEQFIPKGFLYTPDNTRMPAINSQRYKDIARADQREAEIYHKKKARSDFEDYVIFNMERDLSARRAGWRRY